MVDVMEVAKFFIDYGEKSGNPMTNMRLNKLLYFAQGAYLARTGSPLFDNDFVAWTYGPVVCDVYDRYKQYGNATINESEMSFERNNFSEVEYETLLNVVCACDDFTTSQLVKRSHRSGGAWDTTKKGSSKESSKVINKERIREEFATVDIPNILTAAPSDVYNTRNAEGVLILPDGDDWPEYNAI